MMDGPGTGVPRGARGTDGLSRAEREEDGAPLDRYEVVASVDDLPEGALVPVTLSDGTRICLFNHHGTIGAVDDTCTHAEFAMSDGVLHPDGTIECVWHGARFHCMTGAVCRGPAFDPLPVHAVQVVDGSVLVKRRAR